MHAKIVISSPKKTDVPTVLKKPSNDGEDTSSFVIQPDHKLQKR